MTSDDGFALSIGGVDFSSFEGIRGAETTSRVAEFDGGLYPIELLYFDQGGPQSVSLEIDGMPVDQSAFYTAADDIIDNPAGAPLIPVEDYHPSQTLGEAIVDDPETINGTAGADVIDAMGGDDVVNAGEGDDTVYGGYGDDNIDGGGGNDVLIGGRGSDWVKGGTGDDTIVSRSDAGEQKIGQIVVGNVTRPDNGEVNYDRQKLIGWEKQALVADDILTGGEGKDTFLFTPLINAKLEIIEKHVRSDGTINWGGVAGENTYVHDHWVDSFGIDMITDFNAEEDQIVIAGHTAEICDVSYRDTDGDGDVETIITVWSNQSGPCVATGEAKCHCASDNARAGGAHDQDLLGQIIVHGDRVEKSDILVDAGVTYGVVETFDEIEEALFPLGETKVTEIDGETVYGYDTRESDGGWGAVTGSPEDYLENPFLAEASFADPTPMVEVELTRDPFEQLTVETAAGQTIEGDNSGNTLAPDTPAPVEGDGLPGALGYWSMAGGTDGAYEDGRGEQAAIKTYTLYENQALLRTDAATEGPDGTPGTAISFNGEDQFAYLEHDTAYEVTQGTIALWVRADNLDETGAIVTKDQRNSGEGGHFRLIQEDDGHLHLRFAPGNGEGNKEWETKNPVLTEGEWTHLAVSFTEDGVTVYKNGNAIGDNAWKAVTGDVPNPGDYGEAYILQNQEPWVFGADQRRTDRNETAAEFASDDEDLDSAFEGAMAGFGIWGGSDKEDALDGAEIKKLINEGPGTALTAPSGPQPMLASDDTINGNGGNDKIDGGAGDDIIDAGNGSDTVHGGYGDDWIEGGNGNDFLDGGRGSDRLDGGNGNDILLSGADMGEQRIGQLVIGENSRELDQYEDPSVDEQYLKLIDWIDQPLIADDILTGGAGADEFRFETYINGKKDILLEHAMPNRMIHWHGVAGENKYLHDHWVDGFGIDIITDYNASEDTISVKGHTTEVKVDYKSIDTDENGVNDTVVSIITAYSQQGNGGGAHDEDYLGYIVVYGDLVDEDDIITDAGVHYGIVDTIDELQEALAPTGETRTKTLPDGTELFGIDSRDVEGNPIESDPEAYSENPWLDQVTMEGNTINPGDAPAMVMSYASGTFDGTGGYEIPHDSDHALTEGTLAMRFTADTVDGQQALFSKDHSGFKDGGHLTVSINDGRIEVRIQDTDSSTYLHSKRILEEGETYDIAFTFGPDGLKLYLDGVLVDEDEAMPQGISLNAEDTMIGASTRKRWEEDDRLEWFYDGEIEHLALYDRPISQVEAILLHEGGSDPVMIGIGEQTTPPPTDDPGDDPDSPTYPDDPEEPEEPDTPDEPEEP
ncbi:MAG: LamG-like jellyroll fold domain-containing protein, partial [Pseudomonadota bacterium]